MAIGFVCLFMLLINYESNPAALAAGKQLPEAAQPLGPAAAPGQK
jgi:hypothetical protein